MAQPDTAADTVRENTPPASTPTVQKFTIHKVTRFTIDTVEVTPTADLKPLRIRVKDVALNTITSYELSPDATVDQLFDLVVETTGKPKDIWRLLYAGKQIEAHHTLAYYKIQDQSTVYAVMRLRGS